MKKLFKILMINTIIFSLMQTPFNNQVSAAEKSNGGFEARDIIGIANGALGVYGNYLGMKHQMLQQQLNASQNQKIMSQMGPGSQAKIPSKYFPECQLPASMSQMPTNICEDSSGPNPNEMATMISYNSVAQGWINYYEQMSNKASNAAYPSGLRCLEDKQKEMDSKLIEMVNNLKRLQDRLKQDSQIFRDNNKRLLEDMKTANEELLGTGDEASAKKNLQTKTQDFARFFSQGCQGIIGKDEIKNGTQVGFNGILQGLSSKNKDAVDYSINRPAIEKDIRNEVAKIFQSLSTNTSEDNMKFVVNQAANSGSSYAPIITAQLGKELSEYGAAKDPFEKTHKFNGDPKKEYIDNCVNGKNYGIAIPTEDILKSIQQKSTSNAGTARNDYRIALKKILDSNADFKDKLAQIKELETRYPGITITYKDSSQFRVTENPYDLFNKTLERCQQSFNQNTEYASSMQDAAAATQNLNNLKSNLPSKAANKILSQLLDCGGSAPKSGSCNDKPFSPEGNPNFCMSHATVCSAETQGCYAEANTQVQIRKTKIENLSKAFNNNVAAMVANTNALFEQQKASVTNLFKMVQTKFPGTNFEIENDMFIPMPELKKDKFGVDMAADGDIKSFLEGENSMPGKIEKLIKSFQNQRKEVEKSTSKYIAEQESAMEREKERWKTLHEKCEGSIKAVKQKIERANADGMKAQAEEDQNVNKFCKKYYAINENPLGACGKAKDLVEISEKAIKAGRLNNGAIHYAEEYQTACDSYNNTKTDDIFDEDCSDLKLSSKEKRNCLKKEELKIKKMEASGGSISKVPKTNFATLCRDGGNTDDDSFIKEAKKRLSKKDQETLNDSATLKEVFENSENISDNSFFNGIKELIKDKGQGNICSHLENIKNGKDINTKKDSIMEKYHDEVSKIEGTKSAEIVQRTKLEDIISSKNKALKDLEENNNLTTLKQLFSDLSAANPPKTYTDVAEDKLKRIGEQMSGPCDMQTNSGMPKNGGFDLFKSDQRILNEQGSSK